MYHVTMDILKAEEKDIDRIMGIYDEGRSFMRKSGNLCQWTGGYPSRDLIADDISSGYLYKAVESGVILGVFFFAVIDDPTYHVIRGTWSCDRPYGVIHRIARSSSYKGSFLHDAVRFASVNCSYIRVDTHQDNIPMQRALEREGFRKCGIIWIQDGSERVAFDRIR